MDNFLNQDVENLLSSIDGLLDHIEQYHSQKPEDEAEKGAEQEESEEDVPVAKLVKAETLEAAKKAESMAAAQAQADAAAKAKAEAEAEAAALAKAKAEAEAAALAKAKAEAEAAALAKAKAEAEAAALAKAKAEAEAAAHAAAAGPVKANINTETMMKEVPGQSEEEAALWAQGFCGPQIEEILYGKRAKLPYEIYAKNCYTWMQMREIRIGLIDQIDVDLYVNSMFSAGQMHQIRAGLRDHLSVGSFARLVFSTSDMCMIREKMFAEAYRNNPRGYAYTHTDTERGMTLRITDDCMEMYLLLSKEPKKKETIEDLKLFLSFYDVVDGFEPGILEKIAARETAGVEVLVARGKKPQPGIAGRTVTNIPLNSL